MTFRSSLRVESVRGTDKRTLLDDLVYETWGRELITVPAGFVTDFASVPRPFRGVFPKAGKYRDAAVVHDYLYRYSDKSRGHADSIFSQAMKDLDVSWWRRATMYRAVRMWGAGIWKKYRQL